MTEKQIIEARDRVIDLIDDLQRENSSTLTAEDMLERVEALLPLQEVINFAILHSKAEE